MGTKNNPGSFDCYANAAPDEPMFILLGRDPFAAALVRLWATYRHLYRKGDDAKVAEARACAEKMEQWCRDIGREPLNQVECDAAVGLALREAENDAE